MERLVILIMSSVFANCFWKFRLLSSHRKWETGLLPFLMITFQVKWLPFLGCIIGKRLGEDLHRKGAEKKFEITNFTKQMLFTKGGRGV